jgi:hypothetical protein
MGNMSAHFNTEKFLIFLPINIFVINLFVQRFWKTYHKIKLNTVKHVYQKFFILSFIFLSAFYWGISVMSNTNLEVFLLNLWNDCSESPHSECINVSMWKWMGGFSIILFPVTHLVSISGSLQTTFCLDCIHNSYDINYHRH